MRINRFFLRLSALLVLMPVMMGTVSRAQSCVPIDIDSGAEGVVITGLWSQEGEGAPGGFTGYLRLKSEGDATYTIIPSSLVDEELSLSIPAANISLSASSVDLITGKTQEVRVMISEVPSAGHYEGLIQIVQADDPKNCFRELPLVLDVKRPGQISVLDTDQSLTVKTVEKSLFMKLLPRNIRQEGFFVRVENAGPTSVSFSDFSLSLKGASTQHPISKTDVIWENKDEVIPAGGIATMRFVFTDSAQNALQPDEYSGSLRLHPKQYPTSLAVGVTLFSRTGVLGALFALLLGILVGRMLKSVNNNQDQIELMKKFVPVRDSIRNITDPTAKQALLNEANQIEKKIDQVKGADDSAKVDAELEPLGHKVTQMEVLENTFRELSEKFVSKQVSQEKQQPVIDQLNRTRDAILSGNAEAVKTGYQGIRQSMEAAMGAERSRSLGGEPKSLDPAIAEELKGIESMLQQGESKIEVAPAPEPTFWNKVGDWFFRIFSLVGGLGVSARVRFGVFRPLVALITFLVVLLIGFQEIYLNGGDTFGAEGIYDHLKLFVWGVVSDIFSRTLTDEKTVTSLKGVAGM